MQNNITMANTNPNVDDYLANLDQWQAEHNAFRAIVLDCQLTEEWKWKQPCYTFDGANVAILSGFKDGCALSFFKGSLMQDPEGIMVAPGENTQASRLIKVTSVAQIEALRPTLMAYIHNAIEVEKSGVKVAYKDKSEYDMPEELLAAFEENPMFQIAFEALTPGRQKGYLLHFGGAKQSKSRTNRIEKFTPRILDGFGMQDCVCNHSKRMPRCDGSHKAFKKPYA